MDYERILAAIYQRNPDQTWPVCLCYMPSRRPLPPGVRLDPPSGSFIVTVHDQITTTDVSGLIPDMIASQMEAVRLMNNLSPDAQAFLTAIQPRSNNQRELERWAADLQLFVTMFPEAAPQLQFWPVLGRQISSVTARVGALFSVTGHR